MGLTKERICEAALRLFQERGYEKVSLRNIAQGAGTSIGNLTHHFPRKELLLASLQEQFQTGIPLKREFSKDPQVQLASLIQVFLATEKNEREKSFYYNNICEFYNDSEIVRDKINSFQAKLFEYYYTTFAYMRDQGILSVDYNLSSYINLAYLFVSMSTFWMANASPRHAQGMPQIPISESMRSLLAPYINEKYKDLFNEIYIKEAGKSQ